MMDDELKLKVFTEREHLDHLIGKLEWFLDSKESENISEKQIKLLRIQLYYMVGYSDILTKRLEEAK